MDLVALRRRGSTTSLQLEVVELLCEVQLFFLLIKSSPRAGRFCVRYLTKPVGIQRLNSISSKQTLKITWGRTRIVSLLVTNKQTKFMFKLKIVF